MPARSVTARVRDPAAGKSRKVHKEGVTELGSEDRTWTEAGRRDRES
jgi:hypothetical protein